MCDFPTTDEECELLKNMCTKIKLDCIICELKNCSKLSYAELEENNIVLIKAASGETIMMIDLDDYFDVLKHVGENNYNVYIPSFQLKNKE